MLARFEQNLADNSCRVDHLLYETGCINEKLDQAGVQYVVIKGFSLWPEFCSNPYLRTQCDLDYSGRQAVSPLRTECAVGVGI